ncbi:MAG TPA: glycosyltransferase family 1 protein [Chloroflexi bacterium]|nr:glycosyltransferase family 1 protein [Chloroflexota bacterium]
MTCQTSHTRHPPLRIGFVSTRIAGTDGVSLEIGKWADVLAQMGHECFYFSGESDRPADRSMVVEEAFFQHPDILPLTQALFDTYTRSDKTTAEIHRLRRHLKTHLRKFVKQFDIDVIIAENALSLPVNIPLGLALTELIAEQDLCTIGHHHDFWWERTRYLRSAAGDFLRAAFPPALHQVTHVTINSYASRELAWRTGLSSMVVPNVMDFEEPPPPPDEVTAQVRTALDIPPDAYFILQPTRIVPRKRIEHAIELVRRLGEPAVLVITHASGDEGDEYQHYLAETAQLLGVDLRFGEHRFNHRRGTAPDGSTLFSLRDAYQSADLVTYPSAVEGFGNAFLETIYYRRPLVMSAYGIFRLDIQPKGFDVVAFEEFVDDATVAAARDLLHNPQRVAEMTEHNYAIARRYFGFRTLERNLDYLLRHRFGS